MKTNLRALTLVAFFAALIAVSGLITLPVGPVPVVLQNMLVIVAGILLGPVRGCGTVALFLLIGAIGIPVFSGGRGGLAHLVGPTGGYLVGYLLGALVAGGIGAGSGRAGRIHRVRALVAAFSGMAAIYLPGLLWLNHALKADWSRTIAAGLVPFIAVDCIKAVVAGLLGGTLKPAVDEVLER